MSPLNSTPPTQGARLSNPSRAPFHTVTNSLGASGQVRITGVHRESRRPADGTGTQAEACEHPRPVRGGVGRLVACDVQSRHQLPCVMICLARGPTVRTLDVAVGADLFAPQAEASAPLRCRRRAHCEGGTPFLITDTLKSPWRQGCCRSPGEACCTYVADEKTRCEQSVVAPPSWPDRRPPGFLVRPERVNGTSFPGVRTSFGELVGGVESHGSREGVKGARRPPGPERPGLLALAAQGGKCAMPMTGTGVRRW